MLRKLTLASLAAVALTMIAAAPAAASHPIRHYHVEYRMPVWRERSFDCHEYAHEFEHEMRHRGFEAYVVHHGSHFHVRYRMLAWRTYRTVTSHWLAHEVEDMLRARGYQTRVVHH